MNFQLSAIAQLDHVLKVLSADRGNSSLVDILKLVNKKSQTLEGDDLVRILNKLVKDGYIEFEDFTQKYAYQEDMVERRFYISFEGKYFIDNQGGYKQKQADDDAMRRKIEIENKRNEFNQKLLVIGTFGTAIGAVGLIAWEIVKVFLLHLC